jgi:membrane protein CcdC involved in cytochrome C biogenesis
MPETSAFYVMIIAIAALVLWRRTRSMYRPIRGSGLRLLVPIMFLVPGLSLILNSGLLVPMWAYGLALGLGMVLSIPLIWTTNYEVREHNLIYAKKNWGFVFAFVGIVLFRLLLRKELTGIDPQGKLALFMMVAFGYIIPWRIVSFLKFRRLLNQTASNNIT